jgi:DNA-binding CsgD family transcriptional regulator
MVNPVPVEIVGSGADEAALLLDSSGLIAAANRPARRLLGQWFPGWTNQAAPPEPLHGWLHAQARAANGPAHPFVLHAADALLHVRRIELEDMALLLMRETRTGATIQRLRDLGLTPREAEVVLIVSAGDTVGRVARKLGISRRTVEKHIQLAYDKLGVHNRASTANLVGHLDRFDLS